MKNSVLILIIQIVTLSAYARNNDCGFKINCLCDTVNESLKYSFEHSDIVVQGTVIKIDTLKIKKIITNESILKINQDSLKRSECAKQVLISKSVLRIKIKVNKNFKGLSQQKEIYVITPLQENSCGYSEFSLNKNYIIYSTKNKTADIYFLWTFDIDFFDLKQEYSIWTNTCKKTRFTDKEEIKRLSEIKKSLTKPKRH